MSVGQFLFCKLAHLYHFFKILHIMNILWYLTFSVWLTSLNMILSRYIYVAANGIASFMAEQPAIVYMYHIFFIHSFVDEHLGCFHVLAIVNSAAINIGVHVSFQTRVFSIYMPGSGISGSYNNSLFSFFQKVPSVFHSGCTNLHSHQQYRPCYHPSQVQRLLH